MSLIKFKYTTTGNVPDEDKKVGCNSLVFDLKNNAIWADGNKMDIKAISLDSGMTEEQEDIVCNALNELTYRVGECNNRIDKTNSEILEVYLKIAEIYSFLSERITRLHNN